MTGRCRWRRLLGLLGLSLRQARRSWKRYREPGDAGLVHGLRGKASNRKTDRATRSAVLGLYREKYGDFGPTPAAEKLAGDGHEVEPETPRLWLKAEGLWHGKRRRKSAAAAPQPLPRRPSERGR